MEREGDSDVTESAPEYTGKTTGYVIIFVLVIIGLMAFVALLLPFLFSPTFPSGFVVTQVSTKTGSNAATIVNMDAVTVVNRTLFVINPASSMTGVTSGIVTLAGVRSGMQFMVNNTTSVPITISPGPAGSAGYIIGTIGNGNANNVCTPTSIYGSNAKFTSLFAIAPGATYTFVSPKDGIINLVQSPPIDITSVSSGMMLPACTS